MSNTVGQPYRKHDPSQPFDTLVIGSGIGGLATAALLAKHGGQKVLVLEKHYAAGGFTHVFKRKGYEWDVGVHYIGRVEKPGSTTRKMFDHLTDGRLKWAPMGEVYDRIVIGDRTYDYVAGADAFAARMKEYFPDEAEAIDRYLALIRKVPKWSSLFFMEKAAPDLVAKLFGSLLRLPFQRWAKRTTEDVLSGLTSNRELIAVLTGQFGDYGLPPRQSSFAMHAMLARHYLYGGCYPVGGSSRIAAEIAPLIEEAGGKILYYADVKEILVIGELAVGVRMADGTELTAQRVVSSAGIANTYLRLLPRPVAERHSLVPQVRKLQASASHLCLYIGLQGTAEELELPRHNFWIYPGPDHDATVEAYLEDPDAPFPVVYISFPSAKDPDFENRFPGRSTIELVTLAPFERYMKWYDSDWGKRGEDYDALKEKLSQRLLEVLYSQLPHLRGKIDYYELSTPLSTRHFSNYERGEIYGLEHTPDRFKQRFLRPKTPIENLYLTGQDVISCGVAGAMAAGFLTASVILKRNLFKVV
ncbi:MAG: NAD(P)/FAD-dependent oxidoreductase [Acidobacteriota bacterium]